MRINTNTFLAYMHLVSKEIGTLCIRLIRLPGPSGAKPSLGGKRLLRSVAGFFLGGFAGRRKVSVFSWVWSCVHEIYGISLVFYVFTCYLHGI